MTRSATRAVATIALGLVAATCVAASSAAAASAPEPEAVAIVNGTQVSDAEFATKWPFIVGLVGFSARTQFDGQFCGGSLIDDEHVLTAAHCVVLESGVISAPTGVRIVAKTRRLDEAGLGSGERGLRVLSDVFVHPDFAENHGEGFRNDVAVLRLATPVAGASTIPIVQPGEASLWGNGAGGVDAFVAGWGDTDPLDRRDPDAKFPTELRQATIPLRSDAQCSSTIGGGYGTAFERATNICGGTLRSGSTLGVDSCQGDSGGPLTVAAGDGTYRLAGITSWGEGCAERSFGAYSRLDALRDWVQSIPGATDGGVAIGGPGGTHAVRNPRRISSTYTSATLAWDAPASGTAPERYGVWLRNTADGDRVEELVGITPRTTFRAPAEPTRRATAYTWNVRPMDAGGSSGPGTTLRSGPRVDTVAPGMVRVGLVRAGRTSLVVRWSAAADRQSGVEGYLVQRRIVGRGGFVLFDFTGRFSRLIAIDELPRGARVQVRVRAIDRAGNAGPWSSIRTYRTVA